VSSSTTAEAATGAGIQRNAVSGKMVGVQTWSSETKTPAIPCPLEYHSLGVKESREGVSVHDYIHGASEGAQRLAGKCSRIYNSIGWLAMMPLERSS
jgi:hypothetical protein